MTFGINLFLWTTTMQTEREELLEILPFLKQAGYDFVEIPVSHTNLDEWETWGNILDGIGLQRVCCSICGPEFSLISANENIRNQAINRLKAVIDSAVAVGAKMLTGPYHSGFCEFSGKPATDQQWRWSVEAMQQVADYAESKNVMLGVEYLNRFENYLLTNTDDLIRYVEDVNRPYCKLMYDTFHANIEEKNQPVAVEKAAKHLVHVQVSENDRSTVGQGSVDFVGIIKSLKKIGYDGTISVEAFGMTPAAIAEGAHIYRKMFDSPKQLAADSLNYIKSLV